MSIEGQKSQGAIILLTTFLVIIGVAWNYWLPTAEDYLNMSTRQGSPPNIDFFAYYNAGSRYSEGINPYFWQENSRTEENISDFIYPPTFLPVYSFISSLNYTTARYLWFGTYTTFFLSAFIATMSEFRKKGLLLYISISSILILTSYPLLLHIRNGQMDVLIISLILLSLSLYKQNLKRLSAVILACAALIKVSPALLLIYYLFYRKDFRFTANFIGAGVILILLSFFFIPFDLYLDYTFTILPIVSQGTDYWLNQSIVKFMPAGTFFSTLVSMVGIGGCIFFFQIISRRNRLTDSTRRVEMTDRILFHMNLLVILAFAGKIWSMAYVWMILPSAALLTDLLLKEHSGKFLFSAAICALLMNSKVYGYPVLDSLNLIGNLTMLILLTAFVIQDRVEMDRCEDPSP